MKSVLISIQPYWVEKIASGEKTIEVRKTRPKIETPFKCYIYYTKKKHLLAIFRKGDYIFSDDHKAGKFDENIFVKGDYYWSGKVIGEFVCDRIKKLNIPIRNTTTSDMVIFSAESCLSVEKLTNYIGNGQDGYGWHISNLKIYDKPKELSEFWTIKCTNKRNGCMGCEVKPNCIKTLTRPPQSWCYVESLGE